MSKFNEKQGADALGDEVKRGGTLRVGMDGGYFSDSLDPRTGGNAGKIAASLAIMNGLIEFDPEGNLSGELLESWDVKPGAKEWIFNVRKGITFSSGKTLDAGDIAYSINLHRGETSSPAKVLLSQLSEIKVLSPTQLAIKLHAGNVEFPAFLGDSHFMVVPKDHTDWDNPIGTGAYVLESFAPGLRASFTNRGDYWKPGRGNFDKVEILFIQDSAARTAALQSGEVHAINRLDARTVDSIMMDPKVKVVRSKGVGYRYCFVSRTTMDPFTNKNLRLAMKFGIDREELVKSVFRGYAVPGNDHPLDATSKFYNTNIPQRTHDPEKAAFHFKKAGIGTREKVELFASAAAWNSAVECSQSFQKSMKRAGINITLKRAAVNEYWNNVWMKVPFCVTLWGRRPSEDHALTEMFSSGSNCNESDWRSSRFDALLTQARVELDENKRKQCYFECQQMVADLSGMSCFAIGDYLDGYCADIRGVNPHSRYDLDDNRVAEKAWFA